MIRTYSERIEVLRGWLGEDFARVEAAAARNHQELEAWVLQAILDCIERSEDVRSGPIAASSRVVRTAPAPANVVLDIPPRPKSLPRLNAAQRRACGLSRRARPGTRAPPRGSSHTGSRSMARQVGF